MYELLFGEHGQTIGYRHKTDGRTDPRQKMARASRKRNRKPSVQKRKRARRKKRKQEMRTLRNALSFWRSEWRRTSQYNKDRDEHEHTRVMIRVLEAQIAKREGRAA